MELPFKFKIMKGSLEITMGSTNKSYKSSEERNGCSQDPLITSMNDIDHLFFHNEPLVSRKTTRDFS